jgi:hypothetical protein
MRLRSSGVAGLARFVDASDWRQFDRACAFRRTLPMSIVLDGVLWQARRMARMWSRCDTQLGFLGCKHGRCGAVRSANPGFRLPTPVRWRVGPGTAASAGRIPVAALHLLPPKSWRGGPGGAAPSWAELRSNSAACEQNRAGPFT